MSRPRPGRYAAVYAQFVANNLAAATHFRAHFVLMIVMELTFYATALASVDFVYGHVGRIGVWDRNQFLFFLSYLLAIDQAHMGLVSESFWQLGFDIRTGMLDFKLMRPLSLFFTVFFRHLRPSSFLLFPVIWSLVVYFGVRAGLPWWAWLALPPLAVFSFAFQVAFEILLSTTMFVTVSSTGINFLRMQLQGLSRWPDFVYAGLPRRVFTVFLPVLLIGSAPVRLLFDPADSGLLLLMVPLFGLILWLNRVLWRAALRRYDSASS